MKWSLGQLRKLAQSDNSFHEVIDFSSLVENDPELLKISSTTVDGSFKVQDEQYIFTLLIQTTLTMACAKTLKAVEVPLAFEIEEIFTHDRNDDYLTIEGQTIDLYPVVWSNIYLEKPMRVLHPEAQSITFDEPNHDEEPKGHPAFQDLAKYKK